MDGRTYKVFLNEIKNENGEKLFSWKEIKLYQDLDLNPDKISKNEEGSIDYRGNVNFSGKRLGELPLIFRNILKDSQNLEIETHLSKDIEEWNNEIKGTSETELKL